jgi:hypothetical protein
MIAVHWGRQLSRDEQRLADQQRQPDVQLTEAELRLLDITAALWNGVAALPDHHCNELDDYLRLVHDIQARLMARACRRAYPAYFTAAVKGPV